MIADMVRLIFILYLVH